MYNAEYLILPPFRHWLLRFIRIQKKRSSVPPIPAPNPRLKTVPIISAQWKAKSVKVSAWLQCFFIWRARLTYLASVRKQKITKSKKVSIRCSRSILFQAQRWPIHFDRTSKKISIRTHIRIRINISIRKIITSKDTMLNAVLSIESGADFSHFPRIPKEFQNVNVSIQSWIPHFATSQTLTSSLR